MNFCPVDESLQRCKSSPTMIVGRCNRFHHLQRNLSPFIGADVGHASPGVHRPSLASVVFSVNQTFSRYHALAKLQQGRMEAIADLKNMMVVGNNQPLSFVTYSVPQEAIGIFNRANKCTPERIVFFRDGVSEGEFSRVRDIEVEAIHGERSRINLCAV